MSDGTLKPIEQVVEGDLVLSKDEVSGKVEAKRVSQSFSKHATLVLALHLSSGETIEATGDHPFYVVGKGWTPARECGIGTSIVTRAGPSVQVESVERHERDETVFNLSVEDDYSFFVGKTGAWTHNARVNCPGQGMNGNAATQKMELDIARDLKGAGWEVTNGAGKTQEAIRDPLFIRKEGQRGRGPATLFPDITATKNGRTMRIQTVDTMARSGKMTRREQKAFDTIRSRRPNDLLLWFPKRGGW